METETQVIDLNPIIPNVVRKQYQRGMGLPELCRLYDTTEETLRPIIEGVTQDKRKDDRSILVNQVKELYEDERLGKYAIAEVLGKHQKLIRDIINEHGFKRKPVSTPEVKPVEVRAMTRKEEHEALANRIKELHQIGMNNDEVIEELGIGRNLYYKVKKKSGQSRKSKPRQQGNKKMTSSASHTPKEEPPVKEMTTASLESAVTAFKPEEVSELIGEVQKHIEHKKPSTRVINRDKDVWGEYLSARSQEIHDVAHDVEVVVEDGKLIERTVIAYTLERELGR